jgi:hypothetical protein
MDFKEWLLAEMPVGKTKKPMTFYHGTDSDPFDQYQPQQAKKGQQFWNPLGNALYVSDQKYFAKCFGKHVYQLNVPPGYKYKKFTHEEWMSAANDLIKKTVCKALKQTGHKVNCRGFYIDDIDTNYALHYIIRNNSPYEGLLESVEIVGQAWGRDVSNAYQDILPIESTKKFGKFDFVIFTSTNDALGYFNDKGNIQGAWEVLIYNPELQKVFKENK